MPERKSYWANDSDHLEFIVPFHADGYLHFCGCAGANWDILFWGGVFAGLIGWGFSLREREGQVRSVALRPAGRGWEGRAARETGCWHGLLPGAYIEDEEMSHTHRDTFHACAMKSILSKMMKALNVYRISDIL